MTTVQLQRRQEGIESPARILGGRIGQEKVREDIRVRRSSLAGCAVLQRFGQDYYKALGKLSAQRRREREAAAQVGNVVSV